MDEQDNSTFRIPVSNLVLEAQKAAIEEMPVTPATPIVIEQAFPYRSKENKSSIYITSYPPYPTR